MPRGRGQGRGRGRRRGRSCDRGPGMRRTDTKAWPGDQERPATPAAHHLLPVAASFDATPPSASMAQLLAAQPLVLQLPPPVKEDSQDPTLLTASWSAIISCHLQADVSQLVQSDGEHPHPPSDSEQTKMHFSFDTKLLTANIRRSSTGGESCAYKPSPTSPESHSETSGPSTEKVKSHSVEELERGSSNSDAEVQSQAVPECGAHRASNINWDPQILETSIVNKPKSVSSDEQDKPFFSDHNANFLPCFTSGSTIEVLQSNDENCVDVSTPSSKQLCFHSTVPLTSHNDRTVSGNSDLASICTCKEVSSAENETLCTSQRISVRSSPSWEFAPPLELLQLWPVACDIPTKQNREFMIRTGLNKVSLNDQCLKHNVRITSCQPEFTSPPRNIGTSFSQCSVSKWRLKPPPKSYLSKLRHVKSENVLLKRIQVARCSGPLNPLQEVFSVFCSRCRPPGHTHPRNQHKILKKRRRMKYWKNLRILKSQKLSKLSDENGEIKCCSCHTPIWKCHRNTDKFEIQEMIPNAHAALGSNCSMNKSRNITRIGVSEAKDTVLQTTNKVQSHSLHNSGREMPHITNTTAEDDGSRIVTNLQHSKQDPDPSSKLNLQNVTLIVCIPDEKDSDTNFKSQRVQVPCLTGQEFMEISNMSNPYPYKISGIFGSENGFSACLEDKGDLSNEFDFDISNSGELTLPSYEAQLVVSKDKAEVLNLEEKTISLTLMCEHSHFGQTADKSVCNNEIVPPVETPQPLDDAGKYFNSIENMHHRSNDTSVEKLSCNVNEKTGHKDTYNQTKEVSVLRPQQYGNREEQLTSIKSMHSSTYQASPEKTVVNEKNHIHTDAKAPHNHKIGCTGEQLISMDRTLTEGTNSRLREIASFMVEMPSCNERYAMGRRCNEEAGQTSTVSNSEETECPFCIKEEKEVSEVGKYSKELLGVATANLLNKTDLCVNHSMFREKITTCENIHIPFSNDITVKKERVKEEEEDFGLDGTCDSANCIMCAEEKKQMRQKSVTTNIGPVVVAKSSSTLAPADKSVAQSCKNDLSIPGCRSDKHRVINNSREATSSIVQSSKNSANSTDLTTNVNEELNQGVNSSSKTTKDVSERKGGKLLCTRESIRSQQTVSGTMELQQPISSLDFVYCDNNNCIEKQVAEQPNSLSSNSNESCDRVANKHEVDEVEEKLCNLFSENSEDNHISEIQNNEAVGSMMLTKRDNISRSCNSQEEVTELNIPLGNDKESETAHEDGCQQNYEIPSPNESQDWIDIKDEIHHLTSENTEDSCNLENERNAEMAPVMLQEENTEYRLQNSQKELDSNDPHITGHEDGCQHKYDVSSTNDSNKSPTIKHKSSSDQEYESCFSNSETDSDSDISVQIITEIRRSGHSLNNQLAEIRHSEGLLNNQTNDRSLCTSPLSSISSEDTSKSVASGCSPVSSMTEMKCSESFFTNQTCGRPVLQSPLSTFNTRETCKSVDSDCTSTLDNTTIKYSEGTSNNQPIDNQVSKHLEVTPESLESRCTLTLTRTLENTVDCDTTNTEKTVHDIKSPTNSLEMALTATPVIRVSIPLSSITDIGLLKRLMLEKNRRKPENHTGPPRTMMCERTSKKSSDVQYSTVSKSKRKAVNRFEIRRMNGRGKRAFEKGSQVKDVGDQSPVPNLHLHSGSEKKNETDDTRARDVGESLTSATTKYRDTLDNVEKNAVQICKQKNAHQSAVLPQYEDVSDEEGKLQICEEPLEEHEKEEEQNDNSEERDVTTPTMHSHEDSFEEEQATSEHECDKLNKTQDIEGSNLIAHKKDDVKSCQCNCGNHTTLLHCQSVSSVPDKHDEHCKHKLFTDARDELQMAVSSSATQKESPSQNLSEIKQPSNLLQKGEHDFSSNNPPPETSRLIISNDGNLSDVKAKEAMEVGCCDTSDVQVSLQSEKGSLGFDEGSNKFTSEKGVEDIVSPFRKISRRTFNQKDVHGSSNEEQEIEDNHNSVSLNEILIYRSSKSSTRRISSKTRMKYANLDSLPPSYQILRRDLNEVLEQEKICQAPYSLPGKVSKKLQVSKIGGYRRPKESQKAQTIDATGESVSKKIRREEVDDVNSKVSVEDLGKLPVQEKTEHMEDSNLHVTKKCFQQHTDLTAVDNAYGHQDQQQIKKKPGTVQPEEMEANYDKLNSPEKESTVSRKKCTVRLKRCNQFSWIQCANESTVEESEEINSEQTPISDECVKTNNVPEKNVAAEHTTSPKLDDCNDKSSVLSQQSEVEVENVSSASTEQLGCHSKWLLTERNTSQKIHENDSSSKPVEVTAEAVCFHGHKLAMESSHSLQKKLLFPSESKKRSGSNSSAVGEQTQQCPSQSSDEITTHENMVKDPSQATPHIPSGHQQSRQGDYTKEKSGNRQQDNSAYSGVNEEGDENNRSTLRVAESLSKDQVAQNFIERRSESPHFETMPDSQTESVDCSPQNSNKEAAIIEDIISETKKKWPNSPVIVLLEDYKKKVNKQEMILHKSLKDKIQIQQHVSTSEDPSNFTTEHSVPEQRSHESKVEFEQCREPPLKQPVSACEETNEDHITQKSLQKLATDFQDSVEKLPKSHSCEADSQDVVLHQREPSTHEVESSQTENNSLPSTQHTRCKSQTNDSEPQPHTSQSEQRVTSNQPLLPESSLSCSERLKECSEPTSTVQEEITRQQKTDHQRVIEQSLKERQPHQDKDVEPCSSQAQMSIQQQVQDQHRVMLNTIKQNKQNCGSKQHIAQQKEQKYHKEFQQSPLQQSVIQGHAADHQWHHIQQHASQYNQTRCVEMGKVVPQQQNVYSAAPQAEKVASILQNPMGSHQTMLQQQQQLQHLVSLEQQPSRQLAAMPNPTERPQQTMQQQMEWQQQRAAHHISKPHLTVEQQTLPQNQQQAHLYQHRLYYPQIQQHHQLPPSTEVQLRPSYPHQYHSRFNSPPTWNSNLHMPRQVPYGPLDGQQFQPQQPHFHHQQHLERWHSSRRPATEAAATIPAVLASPSMSGGTVVESEHDRRRILSREAINSFDTGHRIAATSTSSCPMTPVNTENIHTAQGHVPETYMRAGQYPQPNNTTAPMQAPLNTASIHQRSMKVVPSSAVDHDQQPTGQGGRLKIPTPPVVSPFVERVMKHYQPDALNTEKPTSRRSRGETKSYNYQTQRWKDRKFT